MIKLQASERARFIDDSVQGVDAPVGASEMDGDVIALRACCGNQH